MIPAFSIDVSDELSTKSAGYASTIQDEAIHRYCDRIEERIKVSTSKMNALMIAESTCLSFEQECLSDILKFSLKKYVGELVEKYWNAV